MSGPSTGSTNVFEPVLSVYYGRDSNFITLFLVVVLRWVGDIGRLVDLHYNAVYSPDATFEGLVILHLVEKPAAAEIQPE